MKQILPLLFLSFSFSGAFAQSNQWAWIKGENSIPQLGVYGTKGVTDAVNQPGARQYAVSWTDGSGNQWLFGGYALSISGPGYTNDLWKYSVPAGEWTWISGENTPEQVGVYGTKGIAAATNQPGARQSAVSWTDASGNLWLFGGYGYGTEKYLGYLNDLWMYAVQTGQWTWVSGDNMPNQTSVYGTQGNPASDNKPGGRQYSVGWRDASGDFWLFGGSGYSPSGSGYLNDLWKYSVSTNQWTWISGKKTFGSSGVYGTKGIALPANEPSSRQLAVSYTDTSGNLWLFGGHSNTPTSFGYLNDLWKYSTSTGLWTWMSGDNVANQPGVFQTQGMPQAGNKPGARQSPVNWTDASGNFWLFGGYGYAEDYSEGYLSDLWKYSVSTGQWIWMGVDRTVNQSVVYGTKGLPAANNKPGSRQYAVGWLDTTGNLWLLGGSVYKTTNGTRYTNDLWKYSVLTDQWTWVRGDNTFGSFGLYGTKEMPDTTNWPGARDAAVSWADASGNFWLMGGTGYSAYDLGYLNDLWKYSGSTGQWTWMNGDSYAGSSGIYGNKGVASSGNMPGAKAYAARWKDAAGDLWLFGGSGPVAGSGYYNDLWKYTVSSNEWMWKSGDRIANQTGVYGTKGTPATNNRPGGRSSAVSWTDESGNLWLFGGEFVIGGRSGYLNDLWKYSPPADQWTWMGGENTTNSFGVYGTRGMAEDNTKPGARHSAATWTDASGNLWLYGGYGYSAASAGTLNDLWKYSVSTGQWTWVSGSNSSGSYGAYGTKGTAASSNQPGARQSAVSWTDASGNMWLYGGQGYSAAGSGGYLNDLWKYEPSSGQWTWVSGDKSIYQPGLYGRQGIADAANKPGARHLAAGGTDPLGNLWLFGGLGYAVNGPGYLNDLWKFSASRSSLPVQFTSFTAHKQKESVLLNWITAQEQNSSSFIIERSSDGVGFDAVGRVVAMVTASSSTNYSFIDKAPLEGANFYRLKQLDQDGRFLYSTTTKVMMEEDAVRFAIIQNPVQNTLELNVQLPAARKLTIQVRDISGRLLLSKENLGKKGNSVYALPVEHLAKGTYFINMQSENVSSTKTFIKK